MEPMQPDSLECIQCNKCTLHCPVHRVDVRYSPRKTILKTLLGSDSHNERDVWACLTCGQCREACASGLDFPRLLRNARAKTGGQADRENPCKHGMILDTIQKIMAGGKTQQDRLSWLDEDQQPCAPGEETIIYFTGCLPYFNDLFEHCDSLAIAHSAMKIFKAAGDKPLVSAEERCCGHNLLWNGDQENFKKLGEANYAWIKASKADRIVTACAECYYILTEEYPKVLGELGKEVIHMSQYIREKIAAGSLKLSPTDHRVTYQDSCRLGRYCGEYDAPRDVLNSLPGVEFKEMEMSRENSICCGVGGYSSCDSYTKFMQHEKLTSAAQIAQTLVTSCPHCRIHLACYLDGKPIEDIEGLDIVDLTMLVAEALA